MIDPSHVEQAADDEHHAGQPGPEEHHHPSGPQVGDTDWLHREMDAGVRRVVERGEAEKADKRDREDFERAELAAETGNPLDLARILGAMRLANPSPSDDPLKLVALAADAVDKIMTAIDSSLAEKRAQRDGLDMEIRGLVEAKDTWQPVYNRIVNGERRRGKKAAES